MTAHDDGRPGLARVLIVAGRAERASRTARLVAADALLAGGVARASVAQAAPRLATLKWLGLSVFLLVSGAAVWRVTSREPTRHAVTSRTTQYSPPSTLSRAPTVASVSTRSEASANPESPAAIVPARQLPDPPRRSAVADAAPVAPISSVAERDQRLRRELDALRAARQALAEGSPARALAVLHDKPDGFALLPIEAALIRLEALRAAGNERSARRLAADLLREHGAGPYAERLKAFTVP